MGFVGGVGGPFSQDVANLRVFIFCLYIYLQSASAPYVGSNTLKNGAIKFHEFRFKV